MVGYNELTANIVFSNNPLDIFLFVMITFLFSLAIDVFFGELPSKIHPVVIFGAIINKAKSIFIKIRNRFSGLFAVVFSAIIVTVVTLAVLYLCSFIPILYIIVYSILLSSTFSINMLLKTAGDILCDLNENLDKARESVSYLVSRSTDELTESFIVSATIESLTENITDSYVAPVFYYMIFSIVFILINKNYSFILLLAAMLYRLANTMDAMLGYKSDELIDIGFFPAKLDDVLNYIPSRISGLIMVVSAFLLKYDWKNAYKIMLRDSRNCPSPNSGYTMATAAGALDIQLIKKETYVLGDNLKPIDKNDIKKAVNLSAMTIAVFTITILIILIMIYLTL